MTTAVRAFLRRAACGLPFVFLAVSTVAQAPADATAQPEAATGSSARAPALGRKYMVVAAHPLAARAGIETLQRGGNAMDAAVVVQFVLGLVEPQSSGIGGGTFLLHYDAASRRVRAYDGRETAPAAARGDRFLDAAGKPTGFFEAVLSGRSVGVPGTIAVLAEAHRAHGRQEWRETVQPAVRLAQEGFPISPRLHALLSWDRFLARDPAASAHFYRADGSPKPVGTLLVNPGYAETLARIGEEGAAAFYRGRIARDIVAAVRNNAVPGDMTLADLANYRPIEREPLCGAFRSYRVCGMPPPSSGGVTTLQLLAVLERVPRTDMTRAPVEAVHAFSEAGRLAYADRDRYIADPDFVDVPVRGLLAPDYLDARAALFRVERSLGRAVPGVPAGASPGGMPVQPEERGTTHFSIVDGEGNAVAVTSSIEFAFGNHTFVRGFLLNNQLTDFALYPTQAGMPVANRVEGGKRPRSSMSPTLVFDADGRLFMVTGSPGGQRIINYVAKSLAGVLDWGLPLNETLALPNFGSRNGPTELEAGTRATQWVDGLIARGHTLRQSDMTSGVHAIVRTPKGWLGAADPRREGVALGD